MDKKNLIRNIIVPLSILFVSLIISLSPNKKELLAPVIDFTILGISLWLMAYIYKKLHKSTSHIVPLLILIIIFVLFSFYSVFMIGSIGLLSFFLIFIIYIFIFYQIFLLDDSNLEQNNPTKAATIIKDKSLKDKKVKYNFKDTIIPLSILILASIIAIIILFYRSPQKCALDEFHKIKEEINLISWKEPIFDVNDPKQITSAIVTIVEDYKNPKSPSGQYVAPTKQYVALRAILDKCKVKYKK